jgi:hypothetical protein
MTDSISELDWVTQRAGCEPQATFDRLRERVKADVELRGQLFESKRHPLIADFQFENGDPTRFRVARYQAQDYARVTFRLEAPTITVADEGAGVIIAGSPKVDVDGRCKFQVDNQLLEEWQFRMLALEGLFFPARQQRR